jgi:hypothetical protein
MANTLITPQALTFETLAIIKNNLKIARNLYSGYNRYYGGDSGFGKIGSVLQVRKPVRYTTRSGAAASIQDVSEQYTSITMSNQKGVDFQFSSQELTLTIDEFSNRYLKTAAAAISNLIDFDAATFMKNNIANAVGTPGTTPNTLLTYLQATQKLDEMAAPVDGDRYLAINPVARVTIVDALKGLFQSSSEISKQYTSGMMGEAIGLSWMQDQNIPVHTVGPLGGTPLVNGATQTGASLVTDGWTAAAASRLNQGDVFTIAGVFAVNPQNRTSTGALQQFVVTAAVSSDGSGNATIPISPAITPSGAYQNVTASPADNAALTVLGAAATQTPSNLVWHKNSFCMASVPLEVPDGVDMAHTATDKDTGISLRFVRQYVASSDQWISRFDVLYGFGSLYPEHACRVQG